MTEGKCPHCGGSLHIIDESIMTYLCEKCEAFVDIDESLQVPE